MSNVSLRPPAKYMTEIKHVREVSLFGSADLPFWRERLRRENLFPYHDLGKAQVLISAIAAKWMGIPFKELSLSVSVCAREDGGRQDGFYLAHAFNSSRLLAFAERAFFQTPYYPGDLHVDERIPPSITLRQGQELLFGAQMSGKMSPASSGDEVWEGPIFLPGRMAKTQGQGHLFYARLGGFTERYLFVPDSDRIEVNSPQPDGIMQWLVASNFAAQEWLIRGNATHAKGKTVRG
ncbi:MAG: hypothetical protein EXR62_07590 [Chloroflexi bacterium]|nr:hypothetical protein [Chloroflexota bacterium]